MYRRVAQACHNCVPQMETRTTPSSSLVRNTFFLQNKRNTVCNRIRKVELTKTEKSES